jgi:hypothetical protein
MNTFEAVRKFEKLTPAKIRDVGVSAVLENSEVVLSDAKVSNAEGLTFSGNKINEYAPFSDWEETGQFHENLKFENDKDISLTSRGDGANAIFSTFPDSDTIAPTAAILAESTKSEIQQSFINSINNI